MKALNVTTSTDAASIALSSPGEIVIYKCVIVVNSAIFADVIVYILPH